MRIEKHVGIFKRAIPDDLCDKFITFYDNAEASGTTRTRQQLNDSGKGKKDDSATTIAAALMLHHDSYEFVRTFLDIFWICYAEYSEQYWPLLDAPSHSVYTMKVQKTLPTQGYHVWHAENLDRSVISRLTAFMVYLNDVDEGGETEFLFESLRVKPTKGTLVIWPAGYTHTHRGNPPLSGVKYVLTSWTEF